MRSHANSLVLRATVPSHAALRLTLLCNDLWCSERCRPGSAMRRLVRASRSPQPPPDRAEANLARPGATCTATVRPCSSKHSPEAGGSWMSRADSLDLEMPPD